MRVSAGHWRSTPWRSPISKLLPVEQLSLIRPVLLPRWATFRCRVNDRRRKGFEVWQPYLLLNSSEAMERKPDRLLPGRRLPGRTAFPGFRASGAKLMSSTVGLAASAAASSAAMASAVVSDGLVSVLVGAGAACACSVLAGLV